MVLYVKSRMQKGNVSMSENVNVCEYIESNCVHVEADCFDLEQIMESGQCFRIYKLSLQEQEKLCKSMGLENCESMAWYRVMAADKKVFVCQNGVHLIFFCSKEEYKQFWCHYFDLDFDYRSYEKAIDADDNYLKSAFAYGRGIRILNQDPWEMLITFIISQRKNIPAIRQVVESLSTTCGTCIDKENEFFAFPTPTQLAGLSLSDLQDLSLGYRAKYVYEAAQKVASGELDIKKWAMLGDDDLHKALLSCYGVGEKVANCVALFGYHRIGAFPVDVWIDRIQKTYYNGSFPVEKYEGFAGVMQQYMFYYERKMATDHSKKARKQSEK